MKTLELSTASKPLTEYANELDGDILVLVSNNTPVAALVSLQDVDLESLSLSTNPDFYEIIAKSRQEFTEGKTVSLDDMKREIANMD
jgi:PHD/YefM family antitoxin component YafN of YafNO toxin-antitoxin module